MTQPLRDRVAVVTGATRGCGRAIAVELGTLGATVYVAGRSTREERSEMNRPETIDETAELVTSAGGRGIPVRCDFLTQPDVAALHERVRADTGGRLDLLVDDVWGGDPLVEWDRPYWRTDLERGIRAWRGGLETHLRALHSLLPLVAAHPGGLVVEVTDGEHDEHSGSLIYDQVKTGIRHLAYGLAEQLRPYRCTVIGATPGFLRSEAMLDHFGVTEENWHQGIAADPHFAVSETPHYLARGLAALAADPDRGRWTGQITTSWGLADTYTIHDLDGSRPDWGRWMREIVVTGHDPATVDVRAYR